MIGLMPSVKDYRSELDIEVGIAKRHAPSLSGAFAACNSYGFFNRVADLADLETSSYKDSFDAYAEKHSKALDAILRQDPSALAFLRNADLTTLASLTIGNAFKNTDQIRQIYSFYDADKDVAFVSWDAKKKLELLDQIDNDGQIQNIVKNAGDTPLSNSDMRILADKITGFQYKAFGYEAPIVAFIQTEREISGMFTDISGTGVVAMNETKLSGQNANEIIKTIIHENDHALQGTLAARFQKIHEMELNWLIENKTDLTSLPEDDYQKFKQLSNNWIDKNLPGGLNDPLNKELAIGGALRQSASAFYYNGLHYFQPENDVHGYFGNPREQHSFRAEKLGDYVTGDDNRKNSVRKELEGKLLHSGFVTDAIKIDTLMYNKDSACSGISAPLTGNLGVISRPPLTP